MQWLMALKIRKAETDKAYDANDFVNQAQKMGAQAVAPPRNHRVVQRDFDKHIYKERHLVECFFSKIKEFRRVSTRYEKLTCTFLAIVLIAACLVWLC